MLKTANVDQFELIIPEGVPPIDFDAFRTKALENVSRLGLYLSELSDPSVSTVQKDRVVELTLLLFASDSTIVEISNINRPNRIQKRFITEYLRRLRSLNYSRVDLEWAEIGYASEFRKQA